MPSLRAQVPIADPDSISVRTFRELVRTFGLIERAMHGHFARLGISGAQWGVLRTLRRAEQDGQTGVRMTDLGNRLLIRPPSVTGVVDRLERAGLVDRTGSPSDQRSKLVALTAAGRQMVRRAIAVHEKQVESVLAGLEPNEQSALNHYLVRLGQHLERLLDRGPAVVAD